MVPGSVLGRDSGLPDISRPLYFTARHIACPEDVTTGNDSEVDWSTSPLGNSLNVIASNQLPDTPRLTPFLNFDDGVDVNGSDFDDVDFENPIYRSTSGSTPGAANFRLLVRDDIPDSFRVWAMESSEAVLLGAQPLPSAQFAGRFPAVFFPPFLHRFYPDTYFASPESFPSRYQSTYTSAVQQRMQILGTIPGKGGLGETASIGLLRLTRICQRCYYGLRKQMKN
uniref:Non-specific serine/threonine protein kinase (EC) n=1 Tax=Ganoderma boninense TaxID=34458 RepID=A0A5K1K8P7_9APHY|nr:Non-specific serine/threonine protein kinase (EC [Ganoderma boninense]